MPRYELLDGKSTDRATGKFWEINLKGNVIETRVGKVGPRDSRIDGRPRAFKDRGRASERAYADRDEARRKFEAMIAAKCKVGYRLVDGVDPTAPRAQTPVHRHAELEAEIATAPDDVATYLVYADWLESQGDPRAELIRLQHQMRDTRDPAAFLVHKRRDEELRHLHGTAWLGAIVVECGYRTHFDWRFGFIETAWLDERANASEVTLDALLDALLTSPAGCVVRKLVLRGPDDALDAAIAKLPSPGLRQLCAMSRRGSEAAQVVVDRHRARLGTIAIEVGYDERRN